MSLQQYAPLVISEANRYGIDVPTILALVENESSWDSGAKSKTGVKGLMQTTKAVQDEYNKEFSTKLNRNKPEDSIKIGTWYFAKNVDRFPDDVDAQIAAYSATGPNGVARLKAQYGNQWMTKLPAGEKADYVSKIKALIPKYSNMIEGIQFAQNDTGTMNDAENPWVAKVRANREKQSLQNTVNTDIDQPAENPWVAKVRANRQKQVQSNVEQAPKDSFGYNAVKMLINTVPESAQDVASGIIEPVAAIGSGLGAGIASGYAGIGAALSGGDVNQAVQGVQEKYTYAPRTPTGMINTAAIGKGLETAGKVVSAPFALGGAIEEVMQTGDLGLAQEKYAQLQEQGLHQMLGNRAQDLGASPAVAAAAYSLPELLPVGLAAVGKARPVNPERIQQLAGRVSQGVKEDIAPTLKTTKMYTPEEVSNIKTYDDMASVLSEKLNETGIKQDAILDTNPKKYRLPSLNKKVGDTEINYVLKMLNNMRDYYGSTTNLEKLDIINNLKKKALDEGLTAKEINSLARMNTSDMSSYNANGQLSNGITKQSNENIRRGVKNTVDELVDNPEFKNLDKDFEAIFNTKSLAEKNYDNFLKTKNRIKDQGFLEKYGYKIANSVDRLSGQFLSGSIRAFVPKGQGIHTNTAHGMGVDLSKNLRELYDLLNKDLPPKVLQARLDKLAYNSGKALAATGVTSSGDRNVIKITKFKEEK